MYAWSDAKGSHIVQEKQADPQAVEMSPASASASAPVQLPRVNSTGFTEMDEDAL
jgi:hypothetical protein